MHTAPHIAPCSTIFIPIYIKIKIKIKKSFIRKIDLNYNNVFLNKIKGMKLLNDNIQSFILILSFKIKLLNVYRVKKVSKLKSYPQMPKAFY